MLPTRVLLTLRWNYNVVQLRLSISRVVIRVLQTVLVFKTISPECVFVATANLSL
jgi:hypothetical protein